MDKEKAKIVLTDAIETMNVDKAYKLFLLECVNAITTKKKKKRS